MTVHLAREFGFCYGVDRAVEYAYQARRRFPDQAVFLTGEIIHNPHVNEKLMGLGIRFLSDPGCSIDALGAGDVVILPAFGVTVGLLEQLQRQGCTLVDTTCGSVLNVWKNVRQYAKDGYTSVIHGKTHHEETQATASQAFSQLGGKYLVVLNREEGQDGPATTSSTAATRRSSSRRSATGPRRGSTRTSISPRSAWRTRRRC